MIEMIALTKAIGHGVGKPLGFITISPATGAKRKREEK